MITEWVITASGDKIPKYTEAQRQRIVEAVWNVHHLLPHPDDVVNSGDAAALREFHRALTDLPPLSQKIPGGTP